ncbi:MAG TPA: isochorismate synthase [Acidimicrobiales bacterium]|nr:isochorismate synthase [Acidimicrobiales bacterium]
MTATVGGLVATTTRVDAVPDVLALADVPGAVVWQGAGLRLGGVGAAVRVDLPGGLADDGDVARAQAVLAGIRADDPVGRPGTGPVALAALPFDPAAPGSLVIPRTLWGADAEGAWVTVVGAPGDHPDPWPEPVATAAPDGFALSSPLPHDQWRALVADAVARIRTGALDKVVLARRVDVEANRPFPLAEVLGRLAALYPTCMLWAVDGFIGASPELLVARRGDRVESHPLAGTVARSGDTDADDALIRGLQASTKDRAEHQLVIDLLDAALRPLCSELEVPDTPAIVALRNVSHLATHVRGRLASRADGSLPGALELVAALHPTPAVGGTPTKEAVAHLQAVEGFERGRYAGPVGWLGASGDGDLALGIRSAVVDGARASLFAGVGVVTDSDPVAELAETQLKLQALLAALVRP